MTVDKITRPGSSVVTNEPSQRLQLFSAGSAQLAVFGDQIATVEDWSAPTPLPQAPKTVLGVVSIQGRMLTVLDTAVLAGSEGSSHPRQIIALRGDEQLALAVDALGEQIELAPGDLKISAANGELILGVLRHGEVETSVINVKQLFPHAIQGHERRRRRF